MLEVPSLRRPKGERSARVKRRTRLIVLPVVVMLPLCATGCCKDDCGSGRDNSGGDVFMPSPAANIRYVATTGRDNGTCTTQTSRV